MNLKDTQHFIDKSNLIYNNKYDYSSAEYVSNSKKVKIICPEHGEFFTTPGNHYAGTECKTCKQNEKKKHYLIKACKIHKDKYDYSEVNFTYLNDYVQIICPAHGEFIQTLQAHIHLKNGCPSCFGNKKFTEEEIIGKAKTIHNNIYDYSKTRLKNVDTKIIIICNKHGEFLQTPFNHINNKHGCPSCQTSKGELIIENYLIKNNINYIREKTFIDCKNVRKLPFDFFLPDQNLLIEFDGIQHFKPVDFFGGEEGFKILKQNDTIKNEYCLENNIRLIRIKFNKNIEECLGGVIYFCVSD